ncbi:hypothetical protein N3Z16_09075 (plasmid) [Candidatus Megaera polyxenophila]|nr:hypothetical protein N3Z16_09075 [Candidatus Megaera polyxenophila]
MMLPHHGALDKLKLFHLEDGGFHHQRDYKLHRYEEALKSADVAVTIYPKKEEAYLVKVDALFNLGAEEELTAILEEIESINPHTP